MVELTIERVFFLRKFCFFYKLKGIFMKKNAIKGE